MTDTPPKKKVVRVERAEPSASTTEGRGGARGEDRTPAWTPTPEAKSQATQRRIIAWVLWALAIGLQLFAIFWILKQVPVNMWLLIGAIVVTGVLSVIGSLCWKQANRLDPASEREPVKFFVQNQLGAIMAIVSFLPLIILIFLNKNMSGKQKALAGGIGVVVLLIAAAFGISYQSPSQEQYAAETNIIEQLTGADEVYWTKSGSVFHVCEAVPDVNKQSKDGTIYTGTVADAHAAGKDRLTQKWESEATKHCGYTQEQVDAVKAGLELPAADPSEAPATEQSTEAPAETPAE
ncbi:hypothetical protein [Leucobacter sp. PH1c]|uniref:hypothetical protein n=1 Tax=Leucobacter sp. PH1c TaxID=1397278 RepID=UPI00046A716E|nr:hypothetical protein [Leucobacter sp. PH1c]